MLYFVLVETPFEKLLEVAEKLKIKLPIAENDLPKENLSTSIWNKIDFITPKAIKQEKRRSFFTAAYSSNLRRKYIFSKHVT